VWRLLARRYPVIVVGPELEENYQHARRSLTIAVSLVSERDFVSVEDALARSYDGELVLLAVGRLDAEKNPLILPDILTLLRADGRPWRLIVCGEGLLQSELRERVTELGLAQYVDLHGYVPFQDGLLDLYRQSHAFLHVSWTEGFPQVLIEAFASGVPAVATAVGGVPAAAAGAALLVAPGDAAAAARELERIAADPDLRRELVVAGLERARGVTLEAGARSVATFLASTLASPA
jgi:glycosyltransferase involved in cell wall biosynthesis